MISKDKERLQLTITSATVDRIKAVCYEYDMTLSKLTEKLYDALLKDIDSEKED